MNRNDNLSRREFITTASAASALAALGLAGCSPKQTAGAQSSAGATYSAENISWDEECEALVIGSGYAGLAAAFEAHEAGADVRIIEKRDIIGGNSSIAAGDFAVCNSRMQHDQGIEDSVEAYVQDMLEAGLYLNDEEKCRIIAEKSNEAWEWTVEQGVHWEEDEHGDALLIPYGGHTTKRTVCAAEGGGNNIIQAVNAKLEERGIMVETNKMLFALVRDGDGTVVGARISENPRNGDPETGTIVNIRATKGVVLTTGGFGSDVTFRQQLDPRLDEEIDCTNQPDATAESLKAALEIGCFSLHTSWIQLLPFTSPDEIAYGCGPLYADFNMSYAPTINPRNGKRFINELTDRKRYADAILEIGEPVIQITNDANIGEGWRHYLELALSNKVTIKFDTLEDLASHYDIPLAPLQEELDRYNAFVSQKHDDDFEKIIPDDALPIDEGPFYGYRLWPKVHHTMGGIKTNATCEVIDLNLNPIPGLYAAGEITGGVHGACRLGSCATADCLVNGRIAGQQAATR